jgi:transcriptional regulator with XRE-family HTH domain
MLTKDVFSQNLKKALAQKGMTQKEVAEKAGIGIASMSGYVTGKAFPSIDVIVEIANILDVSIDWLCNRQSVNDEVNAQKEETLGNAVRVISSLVDYGYAEIGTYKCEEDSAGWRPVIVECPMLVFKKYPADKSNSSNSVPVFIEDLKKMREVFLSNTIDKRLFNDWISGRFKLFDEQHMEHQTADSTDSDDDSVISF